LGRLLEEGLLLGHGIDFSKTGREIEKKVWPCFRNLAGGLVQWAQEVRNHEQSGSDNQQLINKWLAVADHLQQGWQFEFKAKSNSYEVLPKPENKWLKIEESVSNFEKRIKRIDSATQRKEQIDRLKESLQKLLLAQTMEVAEDLNQRITNELEELEGKRQLAKKPEGFSPPIHTVDEKECKFLFTNETAREACHLLKLDPDQQLTLDQIKKAYRAQAIQYHPDKASQNNWTIEQTKEAEEKFKELGSAVEILKAEIENHATTSDSYDLSSLLEQLKVLGQELSKIADEIKQLRRQIEQQLQQFQDKLAEQKQQIQNKLAEHEQQFQDKFAEQQRQLQEIFEQQWQLQEEFKQQQQDCSSKKFTEEDIKPSQKPIAADFSSGVKQFQGIKIDNPKLSKSPNLWSKPPDQRLCDKSNESEVEVGLTI
jgi:curved DNA-binding protein CbpA